MAARLNPRHQEMVRDKIQASQLINRLESHALGEIELSQTQIRAIEILLKKTLPDLSSVELTGDPENPVSIQEIGIRAVDADDGRPSSEG
jgi:hypothetical protein